jgi:NCS2 family nucleobase:cation symporter-2
MAGVSAIPFSIQSFLGAEADKEVFHYEALVIAIVTLGVIVVTSTWGRGSMKLYPAFFGVVAGYFTSFLFGYLPTSMFHTLLTSPFFILPQPVFFSWTFSSSMLLPFLIAGLAGTFKSIGNLTSCQKINDADWTRPDMQNYSRGTLTDGLNNILSGALGSLGQSTSSGNIGLSIATGATSRRIGIIAGVILVIMAFFPMASFFFIIMPLPVVGAVLIYSICYMIMTGMEVMMSRLMDTRRFFTIGISLVFGFGANGFANLTLPDEYAWLAANLTSPLILTTTIAICLTLIFRIGIKQQASILVMPDDQDLGGTVFSFIDQNARKWGARRDIANRAGSALLEFLEAGFINGIFQEGAKISLSFDEYNFNIMVEYQGDQMTIPHDMPSQEELMNDSGSFFRLSLNLVRLHSDDFTISRTGTINTAYIHFEH